MPHDAEFPRDTGMLCLAIIARLHHRVINLQQLAHEFPYPAHPRPWHGVMDICFAAGFRCKKIKATARQLEELALPLMLKKEDGQFIVLLASEQGMFLVQDPLENNPRKYSLSELNQLISGDVLLISPRLEKDIEDRKLGFSWFIPSIIRHRRILSEVLAASFFIQMLALVTPLVFQVIIDKVLVHRGMSTLDILAIGLVMILTFEVLLSGIRNYVLSHTTNRIDVELGTRLFRHLMHLPMAYYEARRTGDSVARVRELENIRAFLTGTALTVVVDLFFSGLFVLVMFYYSPVLTAVVLCAIPAYTLLSFLLTPVLRRRLDEKFNRGAENQAFVVETINGIESIKSSAAEPHWQNGWEGRLVRYVQSAFRAQNLGNIANQSAQFISKLITVLILWFGAKAVISGSLTVGGLVAFNMLAIRFNAPMLRLVQLWQEFQQAGLSVRRLGDILNTPQESNPQGVSVKRSDVRGELEFRHTCFRYQADASNVIDDLSMTVPAGQVVAIVGHSGSGKSTLARLAQRFYTPQSGSVRLDGIDLSLLSSASVRKLVGIVQQETTLFNRSVRDNIALADPGASIEQVIQAAKLAGAHEFIQELPGGYECQLYEQGSNLSGGQKQRIGIARALLSNPKVLILDEATSALDPDSEFLLCTLLPQIAANRTVIVISHRLSIVRSSNRIVVMDQGRVIEDGTHEFLLKQRGLYARFHERQFGLLDASVNTMPHKGMAV